MAFKLLFSSGGDDQIGHLRRQEAPQPTHALDFANLVADTLFKLLIEFDNFLGSFAQFLQKPRVLDCYDGLSSKILQQLDLLVGERQNLLAIDDNRTDQIIILEHRHVDQGSRASKFHSGNPQRVALGVSRARSQVFGLNYLLGLYQPSKTGLRARTYRGTAPPPFDK